MTTPLELDDTKIGYVNYTSSSHIEKVDLINAIDAHSRLVVEILDVILAKAIRTLFKGHAGKKKEFEEKLSDLRIEKTGGLVFGTNGGPKTIVTFVEAKKI